MALHSSGSKVDFVICLRGQMKSCSTYDKVFQKVWGASGTFLIFAVRKWNVFKWSVLGWLSQATWHNLLWCPNVTMTAVKPVALIRSLRLHTLSLNKTKELYQRGPECDWRKDRNKRRALIQFPWSWTTLDACEFLSYSPLLHTVLSYQGETTEAQEKLKETERAFESEDLNTDLYSASPSGLSTSKCHSHVVFTLTEFKVFRKLVDLC